MWKSAGRAPSLRVFTLAFALQLRKKQCFDNNYGNRSPGGLTMLKWTINKWTLKMGMGLNSVDIGRGNAWGWNMLKLALKTCNGVKWIESCHEDGYWMEMSWSRIQWSAIMLMKIDFLSSILAKVWEQILREGKWSIGTENLSLYDYVHHRLHTDMHGIEPGSWSWQAWDMALVHSKHSI
jgi:hypothetical protein